ncbi:MAG: hypothetical protein WBM43_13375 [Flavobacteriaceae bacterium]
MIAILTADIINSAGHETAEWMHLLKETLSGWGATPNDWEIYRGDEFQLRSSPEKALQIAIELKARLKVIKDLDLRIAIGLGDEDYRGAGISESNGTAYQRSGRMLDKLKSQRKNMGIDTGDAHRNRSLNLVIDLSSDFMDNWTPVSAEMVALSLASPYSTQSEMAGELKIKQSAVSQRRKRARYPLVQQVLEFYTETVKELES